MSMVRCVMLPWLLSRVHSLFHELRGHANRVSTVGVNTTGNALCTGSWDQSLMVRRVDWGNWGLGTRTSV